MGRESTDHHQDPDELDPTHQALLDRRPFHSDDTISDQHRAGAERDEAVRDAVRSEQLTRDADHARHVAETTDDPQLRQWAQAWAYEAGRQARSSEAEAWTGFRSAEAGAAEASAEIGRAVGSEELSAGATYDSHERRDDWADQLESRGIDHEVVASRVRADISQAQPATAINRQRSARAQTLLGPASAVRRRGRLRPAGRQR